MVGRGKRNLRLRLGLDLGVGFGVVLGADGVCLDGDCLGSAARLGVRLGLHLISLTISFSREMGSACRGVVDSGGVRVGRAGGVGRSDLGGEGYSFVLVS